MYMNVWRLSQIELIIYCSLRSHFISRKWIDSEPRNTEVKKIPSCGLKTMKVYLFSNLKAFFCSLNKWNRTKIEMCSRGQVGTGQRDINLEPNH